MSNQSFKRRLEDMKKVQEIQGSNGNWNYDSYMHGMFNGMELVISIAEERTPKFRPAPKKWLSKEKK